MKKLLEKSLKITTLIFAILLFIIIPVCLIVLGIIQNPKLLYGYFPIILTWFVVFTYLIICDKIKKFKNENKPLFKNHIKKLQYEKDIYKEALENVLDILTDKYRFGGVNGYSDLCEIYEERNNEVVKIIENVLEKD